MKDGSACFKLSNVGGKCREPISDDTNCKMMANAEGFEGASYVNLTGDGHDLPYGCILETLPHDTAHLLPRIYWNPKGVAVSNDERIRQVCLSGKCEKPFEKYFFQSCLKLVAFEILIEI